MIRLQHLVRDEPASVGGLKFSILRSDLSHECHVLRESARFDKLVGIPRYKSNSVLVGAYVLRHHGLLTHLCLNGRYRQRDENAVKQDRG